MLSLLVTSCFSPGILQMMDVILIMDKLNSKAVKLMGVTAGTNVTCPSCSRNLFVRQGTDTAECFSCGTKFYFSVDLIPLLDPTHDPRVSFAPSFETARRNKAIYLSKTLPGSAESEGKKS